MGLPVINLSFVDRAESATRRSERGTVGLVLVDTIELENNTKTLATINDIPTDLSAKNKEYIKLAFMGYSNSAKKVVISIVANDNEEPTAEDFTKACDVFLTTDVSYIAIPQIGNYATAIANWVKDTRGDTEPSVMKAVLPHCPADNEAIINFTTEDIVCGDTTYSAAEYCARIAGIAATCPLTASVTYHVLSDVDSVAYKSRSELDDAVDNGELVAFWDGEKVKLGRGVNSLQSLDGKSEQWKKIRIIDVFDIVRKDIYTTTEDNYIGQFVNDAIHKQLLCNAINAYFTQLVKDSAIASGLAEIDLDAQRNYLQSIGKDITEMTDDEVLNANTGARVFLKGTMQPLDAMEDLDFPISVV